MRPRTSALLFVAACLGLHHEAHAVQIHFSGHTWNVKTGFAGPGPNNWSDSAGSVWVDADGDLHLKARRINGTWYAAEVVSTQSFGYGEYRWQLKTNVESFDRNVTLGLFTYLNDTNEIDIEFARWGNASKPLGNFTTQPAITGNTRTFNVDLDGDFSTHRFTWAPDQITWASHHGHYEANSPAANLIHSWSYAGAAIPQDATERVHMNLWFFQGNPPSNAQDVEVVISRFDFIPLPEPASAVGLLCSAAVLAARRSGRAAR